MNEKQNETNKAKPYIGVTGFKTVDEIKQVADIFEKKGFPNENYTAMFGFLSSREKMDDVTAVGRKTPSMQSLRGLIEAVPSWALSMIHYYTPNREKVGSEMRFFLSYERLDEVCKAVQLNVDWPEISQAELLKSTYPKLELALQLPKRATQGITMRGIAAKASAYDKFVSYALIDPSGGKGEEFDTLYVSQLIRALDKTMLTTRLGVAGGFCSQTVKKNIPLIKSAYQEKIFIDAQGRLRTEDQTSLDMDEVDSYVTSGIEMLI